MRTRSFWKYVKKLDRREARRYLEMFYILLLRPLIAKARPDPIQPPVYLESDLVVRCCMSVILCDSASASGWLAVRIYGGGQSIGACACRCPPCPQRGQLAWHAMGNVRHLSAWLLLL